MFIKNPVQSIIEFKYSLILEDLENGCNDFEEEKTKKAMTLLLCCFLDLFIFEDEHIITLNRTEKDKWSISFLNKLKEIYIKILYFYLIHVEDKFSNTFNGQTDRTNSQIVLETDKGIVRTNSKTLKNEAELEVKLAAKYK